MKKLSPKEQLFMEALLVSLNYIDMWKGGYLKRDFYIWKEGESAHNIAKWFEEKGIKLG